MRGVFFLLSFAVSTADPLDELAKSAPFRRLDEASTAATSGWAIKGVVRVGERYLLSLSDQATGKARWIAEGEEFANLKVIGYDPITKVAKIQLAGRIECLRLAPVESRSK